MALSKTVKVVLIVVGILLVVAVIGLIIFFATRNSDDDKIDDGGIVPEGKKNRILFEYVKLMIFDLFFSSGN